MSVCVIFKTGNIHGHAEPEIDIIQGAPPIMRVPALYRVRVVPREFTSIIPRQRHYSTGIIPAPLVNRKEKKLQY